MRYYIIAGEASGDMHASNMVREIRKLDPEAVFRGWGGNLMAAEGVDLARHFRDVAFMGFAEVARNIRTILRAMRECKRDILAFRPDALILVDYPGFNLRMAEFAHQRGIRVIYYISPQVWAWKKSRVHRIKRTVGKMLVILPFETEFYRQYGYQATFVGHPLLDVTLRPPAHSSREAFLRENGLEDRPLIALLPGSRKQEITRMLPVMAKMTERFPDHQFVVAAAPSVDKSLYEQLLGINPVRVIPDKTYEVLRYADAALVTSGTATLEAALFEVPEVVCYKSSAISYHIARRLVKVSYISLVNLIMEKEVVRELIQDEFNERNLRRELERILDPQVAGAIKADYRALRKKLGESGASANAAREIMEYLQ